MVWVRRRLLSSLSACHSPPTGTWIPRLNVDGCVKLLLCMLTPALIEVPGMAPTHCSALPSDLTGQRRPTQDLNECFLALPHFSTKMALTFF
jgi:hypothetical protein